MYIQCHLFLMLFIARGAEYGELADECADAYFWYGKALLEVSRLESGVLGDAIPGGKLQLYVFLQFIYCISWTFAVVRIAWSRQ